MGNIMLRSGLGTVLYDGASAMLRKVPGNLLHANITSCAIFAAISGSSIATAATIAPSRSPLGAEPLAPERDRPITAVTGLDAN